MGKRDEFLSIFEELYKPSDKPSLDRSAAWKLVGAPGQAFYSDDKSGKWCVVVPVSAVDAAWDRIKAAVAAGQFPCAKVSTAYARGERTTHVICVYTRDWSDQADLMASRQVLHELGFTEELGYKRDIETMNGVYGEGEWYLRS